MGEAVKVKVAGNGLNVHGLKARLERWFGKDEGRLAVCVVGVLGSLLAYGLLQERVMAGTYGGDAVGDAAVLVLLNRATSAIGAGLLMLIRGEPLEPGAPLEECLGIALGNAAATGCQYEALRHVSFPAATLAKCAKALPVLLWSRLVHGRSHGRVEAASAALIAAGCAFFAWAGPVRQDLPGAPPGANAWLGGGLLMAYLGVDAATSNAQEASFRKHKVSSLNMTLHIALWSSLVASCHVTLNAASFDRFVLLMSHPAALLHATFLSVTAAASQMFITLTVRSFGAVFLASLISLRHFASILLSSVAFSHRLPLAQWFGFAVVSLGLALRASFRPPQTSEAQPVPLDGPRPS